jgi:hypothetical protein
MGSIQGLRIRCANHPRDLQTIAPGEPSGGVAMIRLPSPSETERMTDLICTLHAAWKHGDQIDAAELQEIEAIVQDATGEPAEVL